MSVEEANRWLMGSGVPSCTFPTLGTKHEGRIVTIEMGQQRDPANNKPKTWDDGSPMMQMIVTLQTEERDATVENDNGVRKLYVASKGMREALAAAVKLTGAGGIAVGGWLGMKFVSEGEAPNKAFNPPKEYKAKYEPPTIAVGDGYDDEPAPAPAAVAEPTGEDLSQYGEEPF